MHLKNRLFTKIILPHNIDHFLNILNDSHAVFRAKDYFGGGATSMAAPERWAARVKATVSTLDVCLKKWVSSCSSFSCSAKASCVSKSLHEECR